MRLSRPISPYGSDFTSRCFRDLPSHGDPALWHRPGKLLFPTRSGLGCLAGKEEDYILTSPRHRHALCRRESSQRRNCKGKQPAMPDHDTTKPDNWIKYLSANNLYGWAMQQLLPIGGFQWASPTLDEVLATLVEATKAIRTRISGTPARLSQQLSISA